MIKVALKHFIYEKCIDTVFKGIVKNFVVPALNVDFTIGDSFYYIETNNGYHQYIYHNATIAKIYEYSEKEINEMRRFGFKVVQGTYEIKGKGMTQIYSTTGKISGESGRYKAVIMPEEIIKYERR